MRTGLTWVALLPVLLFWGCETVPVVVKEPVPPADKLRREDCFFAQDHLAHQLAKATPALTKESTESKAAEFLRACETKWVGQVRRVVLRCWKDAPDLGTFEQCVDRF